jgi:hypothetical protein
MRNKTQYHPVGTIPKFNGSIAEGGKIHTPNTHKHDRSLSWNSTGTCIFLNMFFLHIPFINRLLILCFSRMDYI